MLPRLVGRDAGSAVVLSERDGLGGLPRRRKISGLCLSRLAFVGDANEGRFFAAVALSGGDDPVPGFDCVCASASGCTGSEVCGDVLRRLGAEVSMVAQLKYWLPEHVDMLFWYVIESIDASRRVCRWGGHWWVLTWGSRWGWWWFCGGVAEEKSQVWLQRAKLGNHPLTSKVETSVFEIGEVILSPIDHDFLPFFL